MVNTKKESSKLTTSSIKPKSKRLFEQKLQCSVKSVNHNDISNALAEIVVNEITCALLVPVWEGKSWRSLMCQHMSDSVPLPVQHILYSGTLHPTWSFILAIFRF